MRRFLPSLFIVALVGCGDESDTTSTESPIIAATQSESDPPSRRPATRRRANAEDVDPTGPPIQDSFGNLVASSAAAVTLAFLFVLAAPPSPRLPSRHRRSNPQM